MPRRSRLFDLACGSAAVVVFGPVICGAALMIRLEDGGPPLFVQPRVGQGRRPFGVVKLRTMHRGTVTRPGRWLRATGIDEVPQFLNIFRGEMRMVGPRPLTPADVERLGWNARRFDGRFAGPPGITGLAQLLAPGNAAETIALDLHYERVRTPARDAELVALSFLVNLVGKRRGRVIARHLLRGLVDAANECGSRGARARAAPTPTKTPATGPPAASTTESQPSETPH